VEDSKKNNLFVNTAMGLCKVMPVIPVDSVVDKKNNLKKWRAKEEERHKGLLIHKTNKLKKKFNNNY
jgi:hypothetical protein